MSSVSRLFHFYRIINNLLHRLNFQKIPQKIAILPPDRGKITIYGSDFQQVNLTPNGGVSPTVVRKYHFIYKMSPVNDRCASKQSDKY